MTHGKNICNQLKEVRKRIAEENDIPLEIEECTYKGECRGTCPRCEAEVRYLENALAGRLRLGKVATVAGLVLGLASCGSGDTNAVPTVDDDMLEGEAPFDEPFDTVPPPPVWRDSDSLDVILGKMDVMPVVVEEDEKGEALLGIVAETDPEFPGGTEALYQFIQDNLHYPQLALENAIKGKVYVTFVVETDGSISGARVLRDIGGGCGAEAVRVVNMMPRWTPGKQNGKVVPVQFNLPITFILPEDYPRIIEGMAPIERVEIIDNTPQVEVGNPYAPIQQMEREGVKVIVR